MARSGTQGLRVKSQSTGAGSQQLRDSPQPELSAVCGGLSQGSTAGIKRGGYHGRLGLITRPFPGPEALLSSGSGSPAGRQTDWHRVSLTAVSWYTNIYPVPPAWHQALKSCTLQRSKQRLSEVKTPVWITQEQDTKEQGSGGDAMERTLSHRQSGTCLYLCT